MRIPKRCNVAAATGRVWAGSAYALDSAKLDGDKLVATDGKILAVVQVEREDGDTDGLISSSALDAARKGALPIGDTFEISANGTLRWRTKTGAESSEARPEGDFPEWGRVLPTFESGKTVSLKIDVALLARLADALGADFLELTMQPDAEGRVSDAVHVRPWVDISRRRRSSVRTSDAHSPRAGCSGAIMPIQP